MSGPRRQHWTTTAGSVVVVMMVGTACGAVVAREESCVSWVQFETPGDAMASADLVLRTGGPTTARGKAELFGADATVHTVPAIEVLEGTGVSTGRDLEVISTPVTCTAGGNYPDGDPLAASGPLVLFLDWDEDAEAWRTITPTHGAVAPTADGGVPPAWPGTDDDGPGAES